jgi:hypothetical protein
MDINVNFKLPGIIPLLKLLIDKVNKMSAQFDELLAQVTAHETVEDSLVELVVGLHTKLDAALAANDIPAIQALSDRLKADTQKIVDATVANTVAESEAPV